MRVGLDGLKPPNPSSGLGGFPLSSHEFRVFREHGPRMRVNDRYTPFGEFVTRAPAHVTPRWPCCFFTASTWADDNVVASVLAVPVAPSLTAARGASLGQITVYSEPAPALPNGGSATTLDKAG